jgi:hypothetical protein
VESGALINFEIQLFGDLDFRLAEVRTMDIGWVIASIIAIAALYFMVPRIVGVYFKYRGKRVITCPETRKPAGIEVDVVHAALTAGLGDLDLRLGSCSRWPERQDCGQECLIQVKLAPQDCLLRNIIIDWYADKSCDSCGRKFGELHLFDHAPALRSPEGKTVIWSEVAAESVPELLTTHSPVCWDCYILQTLWREHPHLIVDRSRISAGVRREALR